MPTKGIMISIKAIYKLPAIKYVFFIASSESGLSKESKESPENRKRMEHFEHILQSKENIDPKECPRWKTKLICEKDFLLALKHKMPIEKVSPSQSFDNPESLELLAINPVKTPRNALVWPFNTPKVLSVVPDEDIIEVFI